MNDKVYRPPGISNLPCVICDRLAILYCNNCHDVPHEAVPVDEAAMLITAKSWYCGNKCYEAHHGRMDKICQQLEARKLVHRAAELSRDVWLAYRMLMHEDGIEKVEVGNASIYDTEGIEQTMDHLVVYDLKLPDDGKKKTSSPIDRELIGPEDAFRAILSVFMGSTSAMVLESLVEKTFKDVLVGEITLVSHLIKNQKLLVSSVGCHGSISPSKTTHAVLKISVAPSVSGSSPSRPETYAVDMAGTQFGWPEAIMPWEQYASARILSVTDERPLAEASSRVSEDLNFPQLSEIARPSVEHLFRLHKRGAHAISVIVDYWLAHEDGWDGEWKLLGGADRPPKVRSFAEMLRLPEERFLQHRDNLLATVRGTFEWLVKGDDKTLEDFMNLEQIPEE